MPKAFSGHRRRCERVHPELASSVAEVEGAWDERAETGRWRRSHGFLGRIGKMCILKHASNAAGMHKTMNVLDCLPKLAQPKAKQALREILQVETREDAEKAFDLLLKTYEPKYPKAAI